MAGKGNKKAPALVRVTESIGNVLAQLRSGSRAGKHGKTRPDRANTKRRAIERDRDNG